jgi:hypothetical protein
MKYTINLALLSSAFIGFGQVLAAPAAEDTFNNLMARDRTPLTFDINPDIKNPVCGVATNVQILIKDYREEGESAECLKLMDHVRDLFGDWVQADFIPTCAGGKYTDPWLSGAKKNRKMVFTPDQGAVVDMAKSGVQKLEGTLVVDHPKDGRVATPHVQIGVAVDPKKNEQKYRYIYCP